MVKRKCFYVPPDQFDERGYTPSIVTEDEPGHAPLTGTGAHASPWYWGSTLEEAQRMCDKFNAETFELTPEEADEIVASSMGADRRP